MAADGLEEIVNLFEAPVKIDAALSKLSRAMGPQHVGIRLRFDLRRTTPIHHHHHLQLKWSK